MSPGGSCEDIHMHVLDYGGVLQQLVIEPLSVLKETLGGNAFGCKDPIDGPNKGGLGRNQWLQMKGLRRPWIL